MEKDEKDRHRIMGFRLEGDRWTNDKGLMNGSGGVEGDIRHDNPDGLYINGPAVQVSIL